jgi:hypothetical protein
MLRRRNVKWRSVFTFVLWVPANLLFSLPLAIVFYRFLGNPNLVAVSAVYCGFLLLWYFIRGSKAIGVLLQFSTFRSFLINGISVITIAVIAIFWLDMTRSFLAYSQYYLSILIR